MNDADIYAKTEAGSDELKSRSRGLPQRIRSVLIMVEGTRTVAQLRESAAAMGVQPDFLEVLERDGLIALQSRAQAPTRQTAAPQAAPGPAVEAGATDAERFVIAQKYMINASVEALASWPSASP